MDINELIRNNRNLVVNEGGIPTKSLVCLLLTIVDYKTWYQVKIETMHFDLNA